MYELTFFEDFIEREEFCSTFFNKQLKESEFEDFKIQLNKECKRIKKAFRHKAFSLTKEKLIERYFQQHQERLIYLSDSVLKSISSYEMGSIYNMKSHDYETNVNKLAYAALINLLSHIEQHYSKYFNINSRVPEAYKRSSTRDFLEKLPLLEKCLIDKKLNKKLREIILRPINHFINGEKIETFKSLMYLKTYFSEIQKLSEKPLIGLQLERAIIGTCIYLNFNSTKFNYFYLS